MKENKKGRKADYREEKEAVPSTGPCHYGLWPLIFPEHTIFIDGIPIGRISIGRMVSPHDRGV